MSDNNNVLILGAAILGYMYLKNSQARVMAAGQQPVKGVVQSLPSNVGSGWQQVGVGAVAGFLQSIVGGVRNNTSQTNFPSSYDPVDQVRGNILQEGVYDDIGGIDLGLGLDVSGWA
jgi:hypothetical protein